MRHHRVIQLDGSAVVQAAPRDGWRRVKQLPNGVETRWREGPLLHVQQQLTTDTSDEERVHIVHKTVDMVLSAEVTYKELLDAVEVVQDGADCRAPYEECDGWEHGTQTITDFARHIEDTARNDFGLSNLDIDHAFRLSQGYYHSYDGRDSGRIILHGDLRQTAAEYHLRGASKQVAFELAAAEFQRTLGQLVTWYSEGWTWWGVKGEWNGYEASVWGIDDEEYAEKEVRFEILGELIHDVERDGFSVIGKPRPPKRYGIKQRWTRKGFRQHLRYNLNSQNPWYRPK